MLQVEGLNFQYRQKKILNNLSFSLEGGNAVSLLGKNGVGKSTLFKCLLGLLRPTAGKIMIDGQDIHSLSREELARKIAYIPQNFKATFDFTVFEMVLMGTTSQLKSYQQPGKNEYAMAEAAIALLNIEHLQNENFQEISGGEQQLTIIARSVAQQSKIIVMDEPCANLDYGNQVIVLSMIQRLAREGYLIIQATHDPNHALQYTDEAMVLKNGELFVKGIPGEVLTADCLEDIYRVPVSIYELDRFPYRICIPNALEEFHDVANL